MPSRIVQMSADLPVMRSRPACPSISRLLAAQSEAKKFHDWRPIRCRAPRALQSITSAIGAGVCPLAAVGLLGLLPGWTWAAGEVDDRHIEANAKTRKDWPSYGLNYQENRFSPLQQIHAGNVQQLGLVWSYNLDSSRGVEATPIVVDGAMYVSAPWNVVHVIEARTGKALWTYDPQVPRETAYKGCCDVVNRGVAVCKGKVFVGAFDGRLIALEAATGKQVWSTDTIDNKKFSYTITGAPRVYKGKVYIGNGGAEYGARGYVTA